MDPSRLEFWKAFLVQQSGFPKPERLARQLAVAEVTEYCECGCNSFAVHVVPEAGMPALCGPSKSGGAIFESAFILKPSGKSLELVLFADGNGNLDYVEIDCNGNSEPVPQHIEVESPPYHVHASTAVQFE